MCWCDWAIDSPHRSLRQPRGGCPSHWTYDSYQGETNSQLQTRRNLTAVVTSYGQINTSCSGNAIESEATGWVMSKASTLGLKINSRDYRDYVRVNKMWEKKWEKSVR